MRLLVLSSGRNCTGRSVRYYLRLEIVPNILLCFTLGVFPLRSPLLSSIGAISASTTPAFWACNSHHHRHNVSDMYICLCNTTYRLAFILAPKGVCVTVFARDSMQLRHVFSSYGHGTRTSIFVRQTLLCNNQVCTRSYQIDSLRLSLWRHILFYSGHGI